MPSYRNVTHATTAILREIAERGEELPVRGQRVRELRNQMTVLKKPLERCVFLPHRGNSVFASLAESVWVLAGRDDIHWLSAYVPRAPNFSDDGKVWRGAYGPRLRSWRGVDQLREARRLLLAEPATRRAAMSLYDPERDFADSKDVPCNNWLHWLVRDGHLHLNVALRSNDVWWGFSGVNVFEWSVLQECMARWVDAKVGELTLFASSLHLYDRHYETAGRTVAASTGITPYEFAVAAPQFTTSWADLTGVLDEWFEVENRVRRDPGAPLSATGVSADAFLYNALSVLRVYHGVKAGWPAGRLKDELAALPGTDLTAAAYEHCGRRTPEVLDGVPHAGIAAFLEAFRGGAWTRDPEHTYFKNAIKALHRSKNAAYGLAWKRRGELTSILANVARKVDRLEVFATAGTTLADESILDTAVDLFVYLTKYRLYLLERHASDAVGQLPADAPRPLSDHLVNFDALVDAAGGSEGETIRTLIDQCVQAFAEVHEHASNVAANIAVRYQLVSALTAQAWRLVVAIIRSRPGWASAFVSDAGR